MSRLWFTVLLMLKWCSVLAGGDSAASFFLSDVPSQGILLNKDWKFHAGDDMQWAQTGYEDSDWISVDPSDELHHLPEVRKTNIGWFRLNLVVDSALLGKTFAFIISSSGASEIYFNGKLLYRFGTVSSDFRTELTRYYSNRLLSLKLGEKREQTIAIRHSFNSKNLYLKFTNARPIARITFKKIDQAFADHIKDDSFDSTLRSIQVSFYLPLGFLLLFLFFSFRLQKEYLYCGIFCFCMFAAILLHIFALSEPITVSRSNYLLLATQVLYIMGALAFINGAYILYSQKKGIFYYIILSYGIFSLVFYFISYDWSGIFNAFFFPIITIEFFRINVKMMRKGRKGSFILFVTSLLLIMSLLMYIGVTLYGKVESSALLQSISFLIPGIGLSLFFAGEFARTASALRLRATEVEKLSDEMITKEREKQQILGTQNETLEKQVIERTAELTRSLTDLREAQDQLVQREKMASLGELTAGVAHEIQNPLNFVNNFSEINRELISEMKNELSAGNTKEAISIANNLEDNEEKINHHGKRADAIVKNMLQHSRSSSSQKELTDINKLADEYLRLSYHGFRAKDKSFNAQTKTEFDQVLSFAEGKIHIIPQDIGRVLLNLYNNAFYAAAEKMKSQDELYKPTVSVSTKKVNDKVEVTVKDNGNGIPQKVIDKIFQPFFTTKPTGQGTGLGLSLSYDIVKAHGGEIKVETREGEGAEFMIRLPCG